MKHLHSIVIFCVCSNSRVSHWVLFLNDCIMFSIAGVSISELMIALSLSAQWNICGLYQKQEILFWIEQKCSLLSCKYYAFSWHEMLTHVLLLIEHHMICLPMQWKNLLLLLNSFLPLPVSCASHILCGLEDQEHPFSPQTINKGQNPEYFWKIKKSLKLNSEAWKRGHVWENPTCCNPRVASE